MKTSAYRTLEAMPYLVLFEPALGGRIPLVVLMHMPNPSETTILRTNAINVESHQWFHLIQELSQTTPDITRHMHRTFAEAVRDYNLVIAPGPGAQTVSGRYYPPS